jgi:hypothetical protein
MSHFHPEEPFPARPLNGREGVALSRYLADGQMADVRLVTVDDGGPEDRPGGVLA